jgi:mediator of RNA polymerase II transcription subunit 5
MDSSTATPTLPAAVAAWSKFLHRALLKRLDPDEFAAYIPIHFKEHPLPAVIVADILLRPSPTNRYRLDPRVPPYLNALLKQRRVDVPAVLRALYKYTSAHARVQSPDADALAGGGIKKEEDEEGTQQKNKQILRWQNSYSEEAIILWRLAQMIHQGTGIRAPRNVIQISKVLAKWTGLFTEAAATFSREAFGSLNGLQATDETVDARNAFVLLFVAFSENPLVLSTLGKPVCKGRLHFILQKSGGSPS